MALHKKACLAFSVACLCITATPFALASERPNVYRESLMNIARQFVTRVGGKLDHLKTATGNPAQPDALTLIPDGEALLFTPKVESIQYTNEIEAIKQSNGLYISAEDFINVLELALEYEPERQRIRGWYLREDWPVNIDVPQKKVFYRDKQFTIAPDDTLVQDGKLYISQRALTTWFEIDVGFDLADQYVEVKTPFPLPAIAREQRKNNEVSTRAANIAQLPRKEIEYDWLDINTSDINARTRLTKSQDGETSIRNTGTLTLEGQALKHEAYGLATYDRDEGVTGVTARLSKRNEEPVLLGALKARSYTMGDTTTTDIPLTGSSPQEAGFRVSNNPLQNSDFQKTDINGDALPGWEAELFRDGVLIGRQVVPDNGFYEFQDVQLYAGDNDFEVQFYGPQGERRSERLEVPVTTALLATQKNTYDVSATLSERPVYDIADSEDEDKNMPHLAGRYNTFIGDTLVYGGARTRSVDGKQKLIGATGFTDIWKNTLIDGNFAVDESAEMAAQLSARKNIFDWQLATSALLQTDEFAPDGEGNAQTLGLTASAIKQFIPPIGQTATVGLGTRYRENGDGTSLFGSTIDYSHQLGPVTALNTINYEMPQGNEESEDRLNDAFSLRTTYHKVTARAGVDYQIKPESKPETFFADVNYRPTERITADAGIKHQPENNITEVEAALNYRHDKFRAAPFIQYNTDDELFAGMNMNFSLVKPPNENLPLMTSQRMSGRGLVSSFVYHDKNGNEIFDAGDEPLPDVIVESINIKRREPTDAKGYSLIKDLPPTRATDIHVDDSSLPDPFMISGFEGVSIFPSAGEIVELEFPVHLAGEIDGTVVFTSSSGAAPMGERVTLELLPIDGKAKKKLEVVSASDGYYTVSQVPPGTYLVAVSERSAKRLKAGSLTPPIIQINYDGTVLTQDIKVVTGIGNVPVTTKMVLGGVPEGVPAYTMKIRQGGRSELMGLLRRFAMMKASGALFAGLQPVDTVGEKEEKVSYYRMPDNNLDRTYKRCQEMVEKGVSCEMVVFVRDRRVKPIKTASTN